MIFRSHDIPEELNTPNEGRINLWNVLIASWNDWKPMLRVEEPSNLDHVFISPGTKALSWRLVITKFGGEYPSDHFPITVEGQS